MKKYDQRWTVVTPPVLQAPPAPVARRTFKLGLLPATAFGTVSRTIGQDLCASRIVFSRDRATVSFEVEGEYVTVTEHWIENAIREGLVWKR